MPEFSEVLRRARAGEAAAVAVLYETYSARIERAARAGLGRGLMRQFDPLDICQSVFGDMLRELPAFEDRGEAAFRGWLLTKVHNKLRTKARRQTLRSGLRREERLSTDVGARVEAGAPGPHAVAEARDEADRLSRLLGALEPDQREVVGLHVDEGLAWSEVARRMGLASPDAARMRYARTLAVLRERWGRA